MYIYIYFQGKTAAVNSRRYVPSILKSLVLAWAFWYHVKYHPNVSTNVFQAFFRYNLYGKYITDHSKKHQQRLSVS